MGKILEFKKKASKKEEVKPKANLITSELKRRGKDIILYKTLIELGEEVRAEVDRKTVLTKIVVVLTDLDPIRLVKEKVMYETWVSLEGEKGVINKLDSKEVLTRACSGYDAALKEHRRVCEWICANF